MLRTLPTKGDIPAKDIEFIDTPAFKLKDKQHRNYQAINLQRQFGFIPEVIIVEKMPRSNNVLRVRAIKNLKELYGRTNKQSSTKAGSKA